MVGGVFVAGAVWIHGGNMTRGTEIAWFVAGVSLGVVTGLLVAPRSGRETRRLVVDTGLDKALDTAEDLLGEENVDKGRRLFRRGEEIRDLARDTADVAKRARQATRPLVGD